MRYIITHNLIHETLSLMEIMPEVNRANTYSPEQMDYEWVSWDCDNVSGEALGGDEEEDEV